MTITRQFVFCWLLGALWILCALWLFVGPQLRGRSWQPAISWCEVVGKWRFGVIQINKGSTVGGDKWAQFSFPSRIDHELTESTWFPVNGSPPKPLVQARRGGAMHTVAAVVIANHAFLLPLSIHCLGFLIGSALIAIPIWTSCRMRRRAGEMSVETGEWIDLDPFGVPARTRRMGKLLACWLLGVFCILLGLLILAMPRIAPNYYRANGPAFSWHFDFKGLEVAFLQLNKGNFMENRDSRRFKSSPEVGSNFHGSKDAAEGPISAIAIGRKVIVLPMSLHSLFIVIGLVLFIIPAWLLVRKPRRAEPDPVAIA